MAISAQQMTRDELLAIVRKLPERTPIASALAPGRSSKQSWINWLTNYAELGDHPLREQRDARYIYNHWWNVPIFVWLAEASGVDSDKIQQAAKIAATAGNSTTQAAAIRKVLPWRLVAKHLRDASKSEAATSADLPTGIAYDLEQLLTDKRIRSETTRQALINARLGQGQFRADLDGRWAGLCAVTGCGIAAMLRASHIKPWSKSSNQDRLNPANGILLAAHIDALFDCGLISFADDGAMLVSAQIADELKQFNLPDRLRREPTKAEKTFLMYHRRNVFAA